MPNEDNKLLKYNQGEKSLKVPAIIYVDLEFYSKKYIHVKIILKGLKKSCDKNNWLWRKRNDTANW